MSKDNRIHGQFRYDEKHKRFNFYPIPNQKVDYHGRTILVTALPLNIEAIERECPGTRQRLLKGQSLRTSLSIENFQDLAIIYIEDNMQKITSREGSSIEDLALSEIEDIDSPETQ